MIFDTAILSPWHGVLLLCVFIITNILLALFLRAKRAGSLVKNSVPPVYYAGWVLVIVIATASFFFLHSASLIFGLFGASVIILAIGHLDETHVLSVRRQLFWQAAVALWVVGFGWGIPYVSNPWQGGVLLLNQPLFYGALTFGGILAFFWIIVCMNAINFLDGTDGLATSVVAIACIALLGVSLLPATQDTTTLSLAVVMFSALAAFFFWNAPPAKVYLGTTGSWFLGLMIALLAIIGGGKIVTTLIVLALPFVDAAFVISSRALSGKKIWHGDTTRHVHHRLRDAGIGPWGILAMVGICTALLGYVGVAAPTYIKIIVVIVAAILFFVTRFRTMKV